MDDLEVDLGKVSGSVEMGFLLAAALSEAAVLVAPALDALAERGEVGDGEVVEDWVSFTPVGFSTTGFGAEECVV